MVEGQPCSELGRKTRLVPAENGIRENPCLTAPDGADHPYFCSDVAELQAFDLATPRLLFEESNAAPYRI